MDLIAILVSLYPLIMLFVSVVFLLVSCCCCCCCFCMPYLLFWKILHS